MLIRPQGPLASDAANIFRFGKSKQLLPFLPYGEIALILAVVLLAAGSISPARL